MNVAVASTGSSPLLPPNSIRVALIGNPNTGKTTLFNLLTGLRARTANYPGITVDVRHGTWTVAGSNLELIDLPGLYSLDAVSPEEAVVGEFLAGERRPDLVAVVVDATNVERNLFLASEVRELNIPTVVVLTLADAARRRGVSVDTQELSKALQSPVVAVSAKTGEGIEQLGTTILQAAGPSLPIVSTDFESCISGCTGCTFAARFDWAERTAKTAVDNTGSNDRISTVDRFLTHRIAGPGVFLALMLGVFFLIFSLAGIPMDLVDAGFSETGEFIRSLFPAGPVNSAAWYASIVPLSLLVFALGYLLADVKWSRRSGTVAVGVSILVATLPVDDVQSLVVDGIVAGIGGVVIFLPQICILFFAITLLEDSGYMARAAFVMERLMRFVGLPGKAFVPMLSAHACAIPGIMATRTIDSRRDRLVTILVLPLLTCSARLPVYSMVAALLFADSPVMAAVVFTGAYLLGIGAALVSAWVLRMTILKGESQPLVLELPPFRRPGLRSALLVVWDRACVFLQNAGSAIVMFSVILWAMAHYPKLDEADLTGAAAEQVLLIRANADALSEDQAERVAAEVDSIVTRQQLAQSFAGRLGKAVAPVFAPLGFDWKINVGVISSFAAREVVVSTLAIVYGADEEAEDGDTSLVETLRGQKHDDGRPVFTTATCLSLLVFYVLAMQCLPTQAVTKRETGSWNWAILQLVYMSLMAWGAAFVVYEVSTAYGLGG